MNIILRESTEAEALGILRDKTVLPYLSVYPERLKDVEHYILGEKALLIVMPQGEKAEVHIACRLRDRAGLRGYLEMGLEWLKSRGFKQVFTTAPCGRIALKNMLKSLGFRENNGIWSVSWA